VPSAVPAAKEALAALDRRFPDDPDIKTIVETVNRSPEEIKAAAQDPDATMKLLDAAFGVGYLATVEAVKPHPDQELINLVHTAGAAIISPPHVILDLWAAGIDPTNPTSSWTCGPQGSTPPTPRCAAPSATSTNSPSTRSSG
jgi:hypothetical protein